MKTYASPCQRNRIIACMFALVLGILLSCAPASAFAYTDGDAPYEPTKNFRFAEDDIDSAEVERLYDPDSTVLPDSFDLRDSISVFVDDQDPLGLCDTFAIAKSAETNYALTSGNAVDLSERYLDLMDSEQLYSDERTPGILPTEENDWYYREGDGTAYDKVLALLETFGAPTEEQVPFANYTDGQIATMPKVKTAVRVTSSVAFPSVVDIEDEDLKARWIDIVKNHVMKYGSVYSIVQIPEDDVNFNSETNAAYFKRGETESTYGHAVSIVGWDDSYSKENFLVQPSRDGAWIALNSWGEAWGDDGCYYVSYESDDLLLQSAGVVATQTPDLYRTYTYGAKIDVTQGFMAEEDKRFLGMVFDSAGGAEALSHLTIGAGGTSEEAFTSKVRVYVNPEDGTFDKDKLVLLDETYSVLGGMLSTVNLSTPLPLTGDRFALVFELVGDVEDFYLASAEDASGTFVTGNMYYADGLDGQWAVHEEELAVFAFTLAEDEVDDRIDAIVPEDSGAPEDDGEEDEGSEGELPDDAEFVEAPDEESEGEVLEPVVEWPEGEIGEPVVVEPEVSELPASAVEEPKADLEPAAEENGKADAQKGKTDASDKGESTAKKDLPDSSTSSDAAGKKVTAPTATSAPASATSTQQTRVTAATGDGLPHGFVLTMAFALLAILLGVAAERSRK